MSVCMKPMPQPFLDWLKANDLSPDDVVAWPQIEFDGVPAGTMRIEMFHRMPGGEPVLLMGGGYGIGGYSMREVPLLVPMDAELRAMYEHVAPQIRAEMERDRALDRIAQGATVLVVDASQRLVFLMHPSMLDTVAADVHDRLRALFPGVDVQLVTGVRAVLIEDLPLHEQVVPQ